MNELIRDVPPGANGVTFLPYLAGERAPFVAPHASASFNGLTARSTKADMAQAVIEGASLSLKHCFRSTKIANLGRAFLTGGGARNPLWCDILASVLGATIVASDASDHGLWGVALIGLRRRVFATSKAAPYAMRRPACIGPILASPKSTSGSSRATNRFVAASRQVWDAQRAFEGGQRVQ